MCCNFDENGIDLQVHQLFLFQVCVNPRSVSTLCDLLSRNQAKAMVVPAEILSVQISHHFQNNHGSCNVSVILCSLTQQQALPKDFHELQYCYWCSCGDSLEGCASCSASVTMVCSLGTIKAPSNRGLVQRLLHVTVIGHNYVQKATRTRRTCCCSERRTLWSGVGELNSTCHSYLKSYGCHLSGCRFICVTPR